MNERYTIELELPWTEYNQAHISWFGILLGIVNSNINWMPWMSLPRQYSSALKSPGVLGHAVSHYHACVSSGQISNAKNCTVCRRSFQHQFEPHWKGDGSSEIRSLQSVGIQIRNKCQNLFEAPRKNTKSPKLFHSNQRQSLWQNVECLTPETSLVPVLRIDATRSMEDESLYENVHQMTHGSQSDRLSAQRQSGPTGI